jgi:HSP20 family molecular chaperone IbpA
MNSGQIFLSAFFDGFTMAGLGERLRRPGMATRFFSEEPASDVAQNDAADQGDEAGPADSEPFSPTRYLAYLMLGQALHVIQKLKSGAGLTNLDLKLRTKGVESRRLVGTAEMPWGLVCEITPNDLIEALDKADLSTYVLLRDRIEADLRTVYSDRSWRENLLADVSDVMASMRAERTNIPYNTYQMLVPAFGMIIERLTSLRGITEYESSSGGNLVPPVDIYEDEHQVTLKIDVPGIFPEDVNIEVEGRHITIRAERRHDKDLRKEHIRVMEQQYGTFMRSFFIPETMDPERFVALIDNGILRIEIPKLNTQPLGNMRSDENVESLSMSEHQEEHGATEP